MKGMFKRALAGVAAAALAATGLALGAGAANAASITVNNAQDGHTYTAYKIASYENPRLNDAGDAVAYVDVVTDPTNAGSVSKAITDAGHTVPEPYVGNPAAWLANQADSVVRQFAEAFQDGIIDQSINATPAADPNADGRFSDLDEGWYVITDTTTNDDETVKAGTPMVVSTKIAVGDTDYDFVDMTLGEVVSKHDTPTKPGKTAEEKEEALGVGDFVHYTVTTQVPNLAGIDTTTFKHVVKDTPSKGLDVVLEGVKVYVADAESESTITVDTAPVNVVEITGQLGVDAITGFDETGLFIGNGNNSFSVDLSDWMKSEAGQAYAGAMVYIQYLAQINPDVDENAEVSNTPAIDNGSDVDIQGDPVKVRVGRFQFRKVGVDNDKNGLEGATFNVYKGANVDPNADEANELLLSFEPVNGGYQLVGESFDPETVTSDIVSTTDDVLVNGLTAGDYTVVEFATNADAGYDGNFLARFTVTVNDNGTWTLKDGAENDHGLASQTGGNVPIQVLNVKSITQLPMTGAAGTALFTVLGLLIAGAGALVYMKSRNVKHALRG